MKLKFFKSQYLYPFGSLTINNLLVSYLSSLSTIPYPPPIHANFPISFKIWHPYFFESNFQFNIMSIFLNPYQSPF